MSWFDECDLEYLIGDLKDKNAKLRNEVELTKRMYAKVSEDLCAEQADNERLCQELAICKESEQEKCIEYLRQENIDWEDRYRILANESAKLREERNRWHVEQVHAYGNWEDTYKRAVELELENDKLRELCGEMLLYIIYPYVCVKPSVLVERARELGIEVDE